MAGAVPAMAPAFDDDLAGAGTEVEGGDTGVAAGGAGLGDRPGGGGGQVADAARLELLTLLVAFPACMQSSLRGADELLMHLPRGLEAARAAALCDTSVGLVTSCLY